MSNFWQSLKESTISQAILTVGIWGAIIYLVVVGRPVPDIISAGGMGILGFWFGTKTQAMLSAAGKP